ncbi:hypothetical protein [Microtetraspora niveoalba]|uniref:hypothetical protein n=1 Tax=Microtetraspora niveoalba TaxID=46175 RepID=UPI000831F040|nr:hypothetical protein [Microtetraspora niveoalba]
MILAFVATAATVGASALAVAAHRRHLPAHRTAATAAAGVGAYTTTLAALAETSETVRILAGLVPDSAWRALAGAVVLVGVCVAFPLARWLAASAPDRPVDDVDEDGDGLLVEVPRWAR